MAKFLNRFDKGAKRVVKTKTTKHGKKTVTLDNTKLTGKQQLQMAKLQAPGARFKNITKGVSDMTATVLSPELVGQSSKITDSGMSLVNDIINGKSPAADGTYNYSGGNTNSRSTTQLID